LIQNKCKKKKNVKIRGVLDRKDLLNHLSDSFMMICYSIEESFCISLIEAAAFNNHIVTTNVGVAEDLSKLYDKISVLDDFDANIFVEKVNLADYMYKDNNIQSINNEIMDCYKWSNIAAKVYQ
ncbi:glycosyltransferase, partial [Vibrio fluvialis]|uniref:glycosyltransferase n=1 Tax=Vibrio fluvialis TaxID=676 RepID=UPI001F3642CA